MKIYLTGTFSTVLKNVAYPRLLPSLVLCAAFLASPLSHADWPAFRGPHGNGHAEKTETSSLPLTWSEEDNVTWKIPVPHKGWSTPVVMNDQVWLTTATPEGSDFYAIGIDAETGAELFNELIFHSDNPEPLGNNVNSYASPSPVIEDGRVYVHFGTYGTACIDTKTLKVLWQREDINVRHFRGPGSSLTLFEDLLIVTMDGVDVQYTIALNKNTGKNVWKTDRSTVWTDYDEEGNILRDGDFRKAFCTPVVVDIDGKPVLVSVGASAVFGYAPQTGAEIWKAANDGGYGPAVSPAISGNRVFFVTGFGGTAVWAVRIDGRGDVSDTHVAWTFEGKHIPDTPSLTVIDDLLYVLSDDGRLTCLDTATGEEVWMESIRGNYIASPIYAGGRLYCTSVQGKTVVVKPGRTFEILATNELDTGLMASPAVSGSTLYLRTKEHLYRIN